MRRALFLTGLIAAACPACTSPGPGAGTFDEAAAAGTNVWVTLDAAPAGRVVRVNTQARFVVVRFPLGQMPVIGRHLFLYRDGVKAAEIRISGPQMDDNIVADLLSGDAQPGDSVRGG